MERSEGDEAFQELVEAAGRGRRNGGISPRSGCQKVLEKLTRECSLLISEMLAPGTWVGK